MTQGGAADVATFIAAGAALVAGVLSGLTLYVSGRREERRWRREQLVDVYEQILGVSFKRTLLAVTAVKLRQRLDVVGLDRMREDEDVLHAEHDRLLTRLRLLGPAPTVLAAERLHHSDHDLVDPALHEDAPLSPPALAAMKAAHLANREAKQNMFNAARRTLGLGQSATMDPMNWGNL